MGLRTLEKQKRLESLSRKPAQEESDIENSEANDAQLAEADSVIENPPIDVEAEAPIKQGQKQELKQDSEPSSIDSSTARTIGRLAAGATPTLFALLSHSSTSPIIRAGALAETQKQYAAGKPSKLVPIVGPDGQPIYETPEGAIGEKVYQKPTAKSGASGFEKVDFVDPKQPGIVVKGYFNKATGTYHKQSGEQVPNAQDAQKLNFERVKDQYGNEILVPMNPLTAESQGKKTLAEGIGSAPKIPEYAVKEADDVVKTHESNRKPIESMKQTIKAAVSNLNASNNDSIAQAAGIFESAKALAKERMTDKDLSAMTAEASIFANLQGEFSKAINNQQKETLVRQMKESMLRLNRINEEAEKDLLNRTILGYAGDDVNKVKYISSRLILPQELQSKTIDSSYGNDLSKMSIDQLKAIPRAQKIKFLKSKGQL